MSTVHEYADVIARAYVGFDPNKLGCIMLDTTPVIPTGKLQLPLEDLYTSPDPDKFWIKGLVGAETAHVTLLYGLLEKPIGENLRLAVNELLAGLSLGSLTIEGITVFPSPFEDEPYACIVANVTSAGIVEANKRLRYLPHVDSYGPDYHAHVTIAYVKKEKASEWKAMMEDWLIGVQLQVRTINYGDHE